MERRIVPRQLTGVREGRLFSARAHYSGKILACFEMVPAQRTLCPRKKGNCSRSTIQPRTLNWPGRLRRGFLVRHALSFWKKHISPRAPPNRAFRSIPFEYLNWLPVQLTDT
ncbi:hypothetical protein FA13DRAFT_1259735 [Coprinellus micaceus]|uniref:Uncharacterized protein n=1 Tax=Coprinellus micaceus TaxID=71717 RepID=A0A4Y7ST63_COPMI|nr:hypothetical protein FA13DRAFT_1259735 [Coprinellus micaceus]